ncbi:DUF262 domain-containing protein [Streptomyces sp. NPDC090106]|uniref:DUF262 domain-containing protein n=1 Tax=Streptomyces sp. NPDC090106 TaxID=3365946 RepID=UPI00380533C7
MAKGTQQRVLVFSLEDLVRQGLAGRFRSSFFSRPMVWGPSQIEQLFDSFARGFPVGQLVVYEAPAPAQDVEIGGTTIHASEDSRAWLLIDGLQRLSTLIGAWRASDDSPYAVCYDLERQRFVAGPARHPLMLPVSAAVHPTWLEEWLEDRPFLSEAEKADLRTLSSTLINYSIPVTVMMNLGDDRYELFQRLNQSGASLTKTDIERAQSRPKERPRGLQGIAHSVETQGFGRMSPEVAASCVVAAARSGRSQLPPAGVETLYAYESMSVIEQTKAEHRARQALRRVIDYIRQTARIPHLRLLPQPEVLVVLVRTFTHCRHTDDPRARELLRRWVWRADSSPQTIETAYAPVAPTAFEEAQRLLASAPLREAHRYRADLSALNLSSAAGRLNALGMLHAWPVAVANNPMGVPAGFPLEAPQALTPWLDSGADVFSSFVPQSYGQRLSLGCFLLHPPAPAAILREGLLELAGSDISALHHHLFDAHQIQLLDEGRLLELVEQRERTLQETIGKRVQSFARWGFREGRRPTLSDTPKDLNGPTNN